MSSLQVWIEGVALWTPHLPNWEAACAAGQTASLARQTIPLPQILPPAERRRCPETVSLALEVGQRAAEMAKRDPKELLSVFTSASGETTIIDYLCETLVGEPLLVSPTRFLHSIHNAPAGVWNMVNHATLANTSISADRLSFANGLFESCIQCITDHQPVILIGYDTEAPSSLRTSVSHQMAMAVAVVISPHATPQSRYKFSGNLINGLATTYQPSSPRLDLTTAGMADAQPFLEALASGQTNLFNMPISEHQYLDISITPMHQP